jgi:hypothetical protein
VFESGWKAGDGKDQVGAFRAIPEPFRGRTTNRKKAELVMERAKLSVFKMSTIRTQADSHASGTRLLTYGRHCIPASITSRKSRASIFQGDHSKVILQE